MMPMPEFFFKSACVIVVWQTIGICIVWCWLKDEIPDLYELIYMPGKVSYDGGKWYRASEFVCNTKALVTSLIGAPASWPWILIEHLWVWSTKYIVNFINKHKG